MKTTSAVLRCVALTVVFSINQSFAGSGAIDPTFAPTLSGSVNALAVQTNGELLIGGNFTTVNGAYYYRIARLYTDGSLDTTFQTSQNGVSGTVNGIVAQSDGDILLGGNFSTVNGSYRYGVARLNPNGTVDGSFVPTNSNYYVNVIAVQSDNKVIVGGNGSLYRLNADGTMDSTFYNTISQPTVYAIAIQPDGKILVGGYFSSYVGTTRYDLARLNTDGSLDGSFLNGLTGASSYVRCIVVQPDGNILIGGDFTSVNNTSRNHVARLTSTGAVDTGFSSSAIYSGSSVYSLSLQSDGSVIVGGNITAYSYNNGIYAYSYNVARLYDDGTMDNTFMCPNSTLNTTYATAIQDDGGIVVGGNFTYSSTNRYLARVYGDLYSPQFLLQPTNRWVAVGTNVTFTAHVGNPTPVNFQWLKNGSDIPGATDLTYTLYNVQLADAGTYAVFAGDDLGGVTSSNAILTVGIAPAITQQPASLTVTQGQTATFTFGVSGTPLNYFWKKNQVFIAVATNASLTFGNAVFTNAGTYTCQATNFLGTVTSAAATLTVLAPPNILTQPVGGAVGVSSNFTVSVSANGSLPLAYQWFNGSNALTNFTGASVTVVNAQLTDAGGYFVIITNSLGSATSSVAVITVSNFPPNIVTQPAGGNYLAGSNFSLTVAVGGSAPFQYQWDANGVPIPGAAAASYSVTNAQTNASGAYTVVISNLAGSVTSEVAWVNVGYAPVILQQPWSITNAVGDTNGFSAAVSGSAPLLYQWFKDGLQIPNATNSSLVLANLRPPQIGYYSVSVTNLFGGVVSSNAALNLTGYPFVLWQGLLAWYPFNGNAADASGNGLNGTTNGGTLFSTDRFGNPSASVSFDGTTGFVSVNDPAGWLNFDARSNNYTVTTWVELSDTNNDYCFVNDRGTTQNLPTSYTFRFIAAYDRFQFDLWDGNSDVSVTNFTAPTPGQWCQVAMTVQNQQLHLFFNGVEESGPGKDGGVLPNGFGSTKNTDAVRDFGRLAGANFADYYDGAMDEVRIYNRALPASEVASVYAFEAGLPFITSQPQSETNWFGGSTSFNVAAASLLPLAYQWQFDSTNLSAATNATLLLTNLQYANAGNYCVLVSNAVAGVTSSNAALTVAQPAPQFGASVMAGANGCGLTLVGLTGHGTTVIYASTNLLNWNVIFTNPPQIGTLWYLDVGASNEPQRFYRAAEQ